ncbi:MAG: amino acid ABC transporter substrate-binding protein [Candidatus Bathyarchaeia archaeon]
MGREALTKVQAAIIAIIIVIAILVGVAYYYTTLPTPTPTPTPVLPTPTPTPTPVLPPKDKIVFGFVISLTGPYSPGPPIHSICFYKMLVDEYNAKGGIYIPEYGKRIPIEIIMYDDKSDIETMLRLTEKLITEDKVDFIFPPWGTAMNFAAASLYEKYHYPVPMINIHCDKLDNMIKEGKMNYVFPVLVQPHVLAPHIVDWLEYAGAKNIGLVYVGDLHGIEVSSAVYAELFARGKTPVVYESYPLTVTDLSPLIRRLKDANVDALVAVNYPEDGLLFFKQCVELSYCPTIWHTGPVFDFLRDWSQKGVLPEGAEVGVVFYGACAIKTPELLAWAERFKQYAGILPYANAPLMYASWQAFFQAIEKCGLDRKKVRDSLASDTFDTIIGKGYFIPGDMFYTDQVGILCQWQGGDYAEVIWPPDKATAEWIPKPPFKGLT